MGFVEIPHKMIGKVLQKNKAVLRDLLHKCAPEYSYTLYYFLQAEGVNRISMG